MTDLTTVYDPQPIDDATNTALTEALLNLKRVCLNHQLPLEGIRFRSPLSHYGLTIDSIYGIALDRTYDARQDTP